ncbi:hypothetical protein J437_LFUL016121 [Ladona fulva]|uniref:Reverse transcriptase domain-containing protein n=1 Tax=Ladona fulva TaxID=123851 RepID=A0A8K0P9Q5_LADFU|nr:hypothetical protein J437_LFUL016121 [Ladona fulva]
MGTARPAENRQITALPEAVIPQRTTTAPQTEGDPTDEQMVWLLQVGIVEPGDMSTLERIVGEITKAAASTTNAKPRSTAPRRRNAVSTMPAADIQRLYRMDKSRAFKSITEAPSPDCPIALNVLTAHFSCPPTNVNQGPPPSTVPEMTILRVPGEEEKLLRPVTPSEVTARLRRCAKTTPGPDGIPYRAWRRVDPGGKVLSAIFNNCMREEKIPSQWKTSRTVLLHKGGEEEDLGNWRPIALQPTIGKIFAGVIADRLYEWAMRGRRLSFPLQKGFIPGTEGCFEHNFALNCALEDARRNSKEIVIAWLDLADAFGSVPHAHIVRTLLEMAMPNSLVRLISNLYEEIETRIEASGGTTEPIKLTKGVRQGDPLSPLLFNLAIEPMLRAALARQATAGYKIGGTTLCALAYADDVVLIARSAGALDTLLHAVSTSATWSGLTFKPKKCASLHLDHTQGRRRLKQSRFNIQGRPMTILQEGDREEVAAPT